MERLPLYLDHLTFITLTIINTVTEQQNHDKDALPSSVEPCKAGETRLIMASLKSGDTPLIRDFVAGEHQRELLLEQAEN